MLVSYTTLANADRQRLSTPHERAGATGNRRWQSFLTSPSIAQRLGACRATRGVQQLCTLEPPGTQRGARPPVDREGNSMITTRRGRAKKRRAEEEEPEADPTEALVRTTAALKDAHKTAREAEKKRLAQETEAASLKAERDALATRCAFLESESADAQKAVASAQAEKTAASGAAQLELEKANQARRKAEAK